MKRTVCLQQASGPAIEVEMFDGVDAVFINAEAVDSKFSPAMVLDFAKDVIKMVGQTDTAPGKTEESEQ